jgi:hypothetical protein
VFKYPFTKEVYKRVYSAIKMREVEDLFRNGKTYKATIQEVLKIKFEDEKISESWVVVVYRVKGDDNELPFHDFYFVVNRHGTKEYVHGAGSTIVNALEDAERNWDREITEIYGNDYPEERLPTNPFREAIKILREQEKLEENNNNMLLNY